MSDQYLKHSSRRFNQVLEQLRTSVMEMGGLVEQQVVDDLVPAAEAVVEVDRRAGDVEDDVALDGRQPDW